MRGDNSFGPSVENGIVLRTSVSALTAFDPQSYAGCPRRWWWTRVAGEKEPMTVAQGVGVDGHSQCEHYLKTGSDVLGPVARAGKHLLPRPGSDLVIEAQFGDLATAIGIRRQLVSADEIQRVSLQKKLVDAAGLVAGDIPLDGFIDLRHSRGEFVDNDGLVKKERGEHGRVVEVLDHKFTSSIDSFAKSPSEMASTIQMIGYANYVFNIAPDVDHVRVSHLYYQTRGPKIAKKVTTLLSKRKARDEWERVNELGLYMDEVALCKRVEDVEAQFNSCSAYRGCPHVAKCPITRTLGNGGTMSLFNQNGSHQNVNGNTSQPQTGASLFNSMIGKPATPSLDDNVRRAEVAVARARLEAEDQAKVTVAHQTKVPVTSCVADKDYLVDCGDGAKPRRMKFVGPSKGFYFFVDEQGGRVKLEVADDVLEADSTALITPPDAPRSEMPAAAAPLKEEQIAAIGDVELRQRAEEHAKQVAVQSVPSAQTTEKVSGRCPRGGEKVQLTDENLVEQKFACSCGKDWKLKDGNPVKGEQGYTVTLPNHNIKTRVVQSSATVLQTPTQTQTAQVQLQTQSAQTEQPVAMHMQGIMLFVDIAVERGARLTPLDSYYLPLVRELEEQHGAADIRCASGESALGFGRWKGALSAAVRACPPSAGIYSARSSSDIEQVVIEALAPQCSAVLRGMR